jgi:hypothetical protein
MFCMIQKQANNCFPTGRCNGDYERGVEVKCYFKNLNSTTPFQKSLLFTILIFLFFIVISAGRAGDAWCISKGDAPLPLLSISHIFHDFWFHLVACRYVTLLSVSSYLIGWICHFFVNAREAQGYYWDQSMEEYIWRRVVVITCERKFSILYEGYEHSTMNIAKYERSRTSF